MAFLPGLISAGASLLGGILGQNNQASINQQNIQAQEEFAQNGIQWKVADAKAAGINPLAALGASTTSFSNLVGSNDLGNGISSAGQNIGRAIQSTSTPDDRAYTTAKQALDLQHGELENNLLASQIRTQNQVANGPPTPAAAQRYVLDGQGSAHSPGTAGAVSVEPDKVTATNPSDPQVAAGLHSDVQFNAQGNGYYYPVPSKDAQGASFGSDLAPMLWDVRHLAPALWGGNPDQPYPPPKGKVWKFNPIKGYYLADQGPDVSGYSFYPTDVN